MSTLSEQDYKELERVPPRFLASSDLNKTIIFGTTDNFQRMEFT
jgi:hypothetical protein